MTPTLPAGAKATAQHITRRATDSETVAASAVVRELEHKENFNVEFGSNVPARGVLMQAMQEALLLRQEAAKATAWANHLNALAEESWNTTLTHMSKLRSTYNASAKNDPNVALRYPAIASFFQVRDEIGQRAASTRKRRNTEKKNNS
jgi:hypothetical protein